jgi:hypothetical protein
VKLDITNTTGQFTANILAQEAMGQRELIASDQLPIHGIHDALCEELGIKILDVPSADPVFCHVKLPNGWQKVPDPKADNRWTLLVDAEGVTKARIFYKAAFYDRSAAIYWVKS